MSMLPMRRICPNCRRSFSYNPSLGNLGLVCPYCHKPTGVVGILEKILKKK